MATATRSARAFNEDARLRLHGETVRRLAVAVARTEFLDKVPGLIKEILAKDMWRDRIASENYERVHFDRFEDFIVTPPTRGLGATIEMVRNLLRDDLEALDLFDKAVQRPHGGDRSSKLDNIQLEETAPPTGTSREAGLRRLRKAAPQLHEQVISGKLSVNEALTQAGLRTPRISALARPESIAAAIRNCIVQGQLTRADVEKLISLLKKH